MRKRRSFLGRRRGESAEPPPIDPSALIDPSAQYEVSQFDTVRIVSTDEAESRGFAGRIGTCYGFTTPSVANVEVVGAAEADFAFGVHFEDVDGEVWFAPDLLTFVDHGAGATIGIGGKTFVRRADGEWDETTPHIGDTT